VSHQWDGIICYNELFTTVQGGPTTAQFLVMFTENFVNHCGTIYAAPPRDYYPVYFENRRGLYEVIDADGSCVKFNLLYADKDIGQIVASTQFDPIEIIGTTRTKIYGYYINNGVWAREQTKWGNAIEGSLSVDPGEGGLVSGLSMNNRMFTLWGRFVPGSSDPNDKNFNYAIEDNIHCSSKPATIGDWTGFWSGSRGTYCPGAGNNNQLWKRTWDPNGVTFDQLVWTPGMKVGASFFHASKIMPISSCVSH
jgi:hypothetical protein